MIVLSGGTGTPKLLNGLRNIIPEEDITVVVNTGEDIRISGNLISPDVDTVLYLFSDKLDTDKWWGVANDTFTTHETMKTNGYDEGMMLGDIDRATHIMRSEYLRNGDILTQATSKLANNFGIRANILPMSDDTATTIIKTPSGNLHFQDFWIKEKGELDVYDVFIDGISNASISPAVLDAFENEDEVLIGPSNPITSIGPILSLPTMKEILKDKKVVAVSPIIGHEPVSGPIAKLMHANDMEVSSIGVAKCYKEFLNAFIIDKTDHFKETDFKNEGIECYIKYADTLMKSTDISINLAKQIRKIFDEI
ncbi:LPPG domain protein containing protein [Methanohalobium evestigatum Z-7303]|uniref:2-phospho-L-lactate transferase n=1 Tax=Methanohalobium evestigatum (strain ATCC BAA-1072 / DSM 3721 / NBRC 107634 / OCM 161 / Z-7303) TaxID=644295 RepID=D7E875_METEZ|nr:2-phospho-L-lactate transferase [Methanohalobium evestigatum]ADI73417.1 LPPG domain protein containing protein [Methanohalobium evestigatum Z-7303]